jgi:three-Cys-motif partner protein
VWPAEPHTRAKHAVLENYLKGWFPILGKRSGRIIYLDGFAGPGVYTGGEEGSPVIAIRTAIGHKLRKQFTAELVFYFIEKDAARAAKLKEVLKDRFPQIPSGMMYEVEGAEFAPTLEQVLDRLEKQGAKLAPTFAFLDPFGFSGLPMNLIGRMLSYDKCEVLITFMAGFVKRFTDELRESTLDELFGTDGWRKIRTLDRPRERLRFLLNLYERQLEQAGGAKHVRSFGMIGDQNQLLYYLVYGTKHWKGLEVMKEAMWKVDRRGTYTFSDLTDVNQTYIIDWQNSAYWVPIAAGMVHDRFKGDTVEESVVHQFVITDTPFIYRKPILKHLESGCHPPKIRSVTGRKKRLSYPEGCVITFSN